MKGKETKKIVKKEMEKPFCIYSPKFLILILGVVLISITCSEFIYIQKFKSDFKNKELRLYKQIKLTQQQKDFSINELETTYNKKNESEINNLIKDFEFIRQGFLKDLAPLNISTWRAYTLKNKKDLPPITLSYPTTWIKSEEVDGGHGYHYDFYDITKYKPIQSKNNNNYEKEAFVALLSILSSNMQYDTSSYLTETSSEKISISNNEASLEIGKLKNKNKRYSNLEEEVSVLTIDGIGQKNYKLIFEMGTETEEKKELFKLITASFIL